MAAPKAPVLDATGKATKHRHARGGDLRRPSVKPHLVHETVRAEAAAARSGHEGDEEPRHGRRWGVEAVAAEGNRARARRIDPGVRSGWAAASRSRMFRAPSS